MAQPRPTRLYETPEPPPRNAEIIDVSFKVVKGRRSRLAAFGVWALAFAAAAAIGFLVPPLWLALREIGAMLSGN